MDLDSYDCPQYLSLNSDLFQVNNDNDSSGDMQYLSDHLSLASSEEQSVMNTNAAESKASKLKTKTTIPVPFKFETDKRKKKSSNINSKDEEKDFKSQLRQHKALQSTTSGITKVKPFNLTKTKTKKRKREEDYMPLAEQVNAFQNKTPQRYHSTLLKAFQPQEHWSPPKLRPRTPNLRAMKRHRVVEALSREEQEAKELEEIKAYEFRAQPVDPRVYKPTFIEKTEIKKMTKAENIELKTAQRVDARRRKISEKTYRFRARPVPKSILAGPVGLGEKPKVIVTKPKSPSFTTEKRLRKRILEQSHQTSDYPPATKKTKIVKRKPSTPAEPVKLKPTEIKPFSFDKIDQERFALKNKRIQEEIEKENKPFVFRAQLLPPSEVSMLPQVQKKPFTQPQPFNFCLDKRNLRSFTKQEESVSFKAQPASVLNKAPFIPKKPQKEIIEIQAFDLHTDRRASERLKLKEQLDAEEIEREQKLLAEKALEEEKERHAILKLRQDLVHKANPVRQYKTIEVKPSSKPLTSPISPKFETDKRLRARYEDGE